MLFRSRTTPPLDPAAPAARPETVSLALGFFVAHLLTLWSLALSNVLLGLALLAVPRELRRRWAELARFRSLWLALGAYVLFLVASIVASYEPRLSLGGWTEIFSLSTLVLAVALLPGEAMARRLVDALTALCAVIAGAGLTQFLVGYGDIDNRIRGPLSHYMTFSGLLLVGDLLLLARLTRPGGWRSPWRWVALVLINAALLGSLTRSAWVALALTLLVLVWIRRPRFLLLVPTAALFFLLVAPVPLLHRVASITDLKDESNYDRLCMARAAYRMIAERPLFGIGPNLVKHRYPIYRETTAPRYTVPHLHNSFLQLAAERGLPALLAYLALTALALRQAWRLARQEGGWSSPRGDLLLGVVLALLAFNLAGLFENNWGDTEVQRLVLFVLAVPFVLAKDEARREVAAGEVAA